MTIQQQYNLILEGKGNREFFLKTARNLFPDYLTVYQDFNTSVNVLKSKSILSENKKATQPTRVEDWAKIFKQNVTDEVSKEVKDLQDQAYDNKDLKNINNLNFNEVLKGFYLEMGLPENKDKNPDQLKTIVAKNLAKDPLYYTKDGMFSIKGLGFTDEAPGLGKPVDAKGEHKSSGYGEIKQDSDIVKNSANNAKKNVSLPKDKQAPDKPKGVKEMTQTPQSSAGVKKMKAPGEEKKIKLKENLEEGKYIYKFNPKKDRYDILRGEYLITYFEDESEAKSHIEKLNRISKGYEYMNKNRKDIQETKYSLSDLMENENPFQDDEDSPFFKPTEDDTNMDGVDPYDEIEYLEMELQRAESPEQRAEIEAKIKALEAGLEDLDESHTSNPNNKYIVKFSKENNTWQVWEGDKIITDFATKENAQAYAKNKNLTQELDESNIKDLETKVRDILKDEDYKLTQRLSDYLLRYKFWKKLPSNLKAELEKVVSVYEDPDYGDEELKQYAYILK